MAAVGLDRELDRLELELEDLASSLLFHQVAMEEACRDYMQKEEDLLDVHKMRAGGLSVRG
jgi:hypothetical protein